MENNETYVSLETAKKLANRGFNWPVRGFYDWYGRLCVSCPDPVDYNIDYNDADPMYSAPTIEVAHKWMREVGEYHVMVNCIGKKNWLPTVQHVTNADDHIVEGKYAKIGGNGFDTYEEAMEAGLNYGLDIMNGSQGSTSDE